MRIHGPATASVLAVITLTVSAPPSVADSGDAVSTAVASARGASCPPLRPNPIAQAAAADINRSSDRWVDFAARARPTPDALPVLKDLGYGGGRAMTLSGAAPTVDIAIKALVLQGFRAIPDCSYTDIGGNTLFNESKQMYFVTAVLAG